MDATRRARRPASAAFGASLGALAALAPASGARGETLVQALAAAYRDNPELGAERARQRADDHNVRRALSGYYPSADLTVGFGPTIEREVGARAVSVTRPLTVGLNASQSLLDFGRTAAAVRSAESGVLAGRETLRGIEQTVLLSSVGAYMDILRDRALVDLARGNVDFLVEQVRIVRRRVETGDLRLTDLSQTESRLARGRADLATAQANLLASRAAFRRAVGHEPGTLVFPEGEPRTPPSLAASRALGRERSPTVRAAVHVVDGATVDVNAAEAELRPSLGLQAGTSRTLGRSAAAAEDAPPALSAALSLNVPVYAGGGEYALVRQAKETVGQRRAELAVARDGVTADVRAAWGALEAARAAVPAAEAAVAANEVALAGVMREASGGQRTTLDVLNAQQELTAARTALLTARRDRIVAAYGLLAASGGLTASRLGLPGERYRPETHYRQVRDLHVGTRTPDGR